MAMSPAHQAVEVGDLKLLHDLIEARLDINEEYDGLTLLPMLSTWKSIVINRREIRFTLMRRRCSLRWGRILIVAQPGGLELAQSIWPS